MPRHDRQEGCLVLLLVGEGQGTHGATVEAVGEGHNLVRGRRLQGTQHTGKKTMCVLLNGPLKQFAKDTIS
jgi:hypothetical protein